jgi:hypothetical protein
MSADCVEVPLSGGFTNAGLVTRIGDTVRRPQGPTSRASRAVLEHLERVGFDGAPRFLGIDHQGREVLKFIPGEAATEPYEGWALTDEALVSVAELLRRYHEAVASFDPAGHAWPEFVPPEFRGGVISHDDPNVDNVIFCGDRAVALIDFDLASPGSEVWDVACAARLWAPLRDERDTPDPVRGRTVDRLRLFVDAYGLSRRDRVVRDALDRGHDAFGRMWRDGGRERADRTRDWLAAHDAEMRAALQAR